MRGISIPRLRNRDKRADPQPPKDTGQSLVPGKSLDANPPPPSERTPDTTSREYLDVGAVSLVSVFGVLAWMETYRKLTDWIWDGSYVSSVLPPPYAMGPLRRPHSVKIGHHSDSGVGEDVRVDYSEMRQSDGPGHRLSECSQVAR
jgi:hypothetical protein